MTETQVGGVPQTTVVISGVLSPQHQTLQLHRGSSRLIDAIVTVNGVTMPHQGLGAYWGDLPQAVPEGGTLKLKVVSRGVTIEASGKAIATPTITAPAAGRSVAATDSVTLAWSTPTDPDYFIVCLSCGYDGEQSLVSGSVREHKIARSLLDWYGGSGGTVVTVTATKTKFLKLAGSPDALLLVDFYAKSRDALITLMQ